MPCTDTGVSPSLIVVKKKIEDDSYLEDGTFVSCDDGSFVSHQDAHPIFYGPWFVCKTCRASFKEEKHYLSHRLMQHPAIECSLCKRKFVRQQDLTRHIITKHGPASHVSCQLCPSTFSCKDYLLEHVRRCHRSAARQ
ncbi:hypothetical protein HPB49_023043 [Dermacentor silvarum]|uniref:Uncharacterized protein n=2 Tax=Dermacentor silvarum TaxID=543639 RepID=A0ACB8DRJ0_DERSI|nr:hypothetical protein HPB49_023043 [Dermacentor silvarum]